MSSFFADAGPAAKGKKVALCTTVYDSPSAAYVFSIQRSRQALSDAGIQSAYYLLSGNCHVDDARNSVVQEFLLSDCTDLVFLDADVSWKPKELVKLCRFDVDIVGGVYPYRRDDEKSKANMPVVMYPGQVEPDERGLIEVAGLPTGFMKIKRHVLETLAKDANQYWNRTDRRSKVPILFERTFFDGVRLGGDLSFCKKWILRGGKVFAAADIHLGHAASSIVYDSLGAALRRQGGETLKYLVKKVREEGFDPNIFTEARRAFSNSFGALEDVLSLCSVMGKQAQGPIIEAGSGLTSVVLGAASRDQVFCLEHDPLWAAKTEKMVAEAGLSNVNVMRCEIKDGWYSLPSIPKEFALGLNDGPPRTLGSRMGFFERFGNTDSIICDDADDKGYGDALSQWCASNKRRIDFIDRAAVIRRLT